MTQTENSNFSVCILVATVMCMPGLGFQFVALNPLAPVFQAMFNETYQNRYNETLPSSTWIALLSISSSSITIGAAIGSISVGRLLMYISRKNVFQLCNSCLVIGTFIFALVGKLTSSYEAVIIGRIVIGLSNGIGFVIGPILIIEVSTRDRQSFWLCTSSLCIGFGILIGAIFTHPKVLGTEELWPLAIVLRSLLNLFYILISWKIPKTPFYTARQDDKDKTMALLKKLRIGSQAALEREYENILEEIKGKKAVLLSEVFKKKQYRMQFINVCCLYANIQLNGVTPILLYSDRIFRIAGIPNDQVTNVTVGLFGVRFIASIFGVKLVERFGGRKILLVSHSVGIISLVLFVSSQATVDLAPAALPYVAVIAIGIFLIFYSGGTFLAATSLPAIITIEPTRSTIHYLGCVIVCNWILGWFVGFIAPYMEVLGAYSFTPWIGCSIVLFVYYVMFIPETKGRSIAQIQAKLNYRRFSSKPVSIPMQSSQAFPVTIT